MVDNRAERRPAWPALATSLFSRPAVEVKSPMAEPVVYTTVYDMFGWVDTNASVSFPKPFSPAYCRHFARGACFVSNGMLLPSPLPLAHVVARRHLCLRCKCASPWQTPDERWAFWASSPALGQTQ